MPVDLKPFDLGSVEWEPFTVSEPDSVVEDMPINGGRDVFGVIRDGINERLRQSGKPEIAIPGRDLSRPRETEEPEPEMSMEEVAEYVRQNAPSPLRVLLGPQFVAEGVTEAVTGEDLQQTPRLERVPLSEVEGPGEAFEGFVKNAALSIDEVMPALASLPFDFMANPGATTRALAMYAPEQFSNVLAADLLYLGELFGDPGPEYYEKREKARAALYEDPLGPVFATQIIRGAAKASTSGLKKMREFVREQRMLTEHRTAYNAALNDSRIEILDIEPEGLIEPSVRTPKAEGSRLPQEGLQPRGSVLSRMNEQLMYEKIVKEATERQIVKGESRTGAVETDPVSFQEGLRLQERFKKVTGMELDIGRLNTDVNARVKAHRNRMENLKKGIPKETDISKRLEQQQKTLPESELEIIPDDIDMPTHGRIRSFMTTVPRNAAEYKVQQMALERAGQMQSRRMQIEKIAKEGKKRFSAKEREQMIYAREKTADPKTGRRSDLSPAAKEYVDRVGAILEDQWSLLEDAGLVDGAAKIESYLDHFWTGKKATRRKWATSIRKGRKVPSYKEGIEMGLKPLYTDIADILRVGDELKTRALANSEFVKGLFETTDANGNRMLVPKSKKTEFLKDEGWREVSDPALNKLTFRTVINSSGKKFAVAQETPVLVHPAFADAVANVFKEPFMSKNAWTRTLRFLNATAKSSQLSFSLFHYWALTESSVGVMGPMGPFRAVGGLKLLDDARFIDHSSKAGVSYGASHDVGASIVNKGLRKLEAKTRGVPLVAQGARFLRGFKELWDKALWDKYHRGLKAYAFHTLEANMLKRNADVHPRLIAQEAAKLTNDFFGGQNWEAMLSNPHILEAAQIAFLAPDWTYSVIRQAARPFESRATGAIEARIAGVKGGLKTDAVTRAMLRGQEGRRYAARYALYNFLGLQALNLFFSGMRDDMEPHFTWDNPHGMTLNFVTPEFMDDEETGVPHYAIPSKQAKEILRWFTDIPVQLGSKASPWLRAGAVQATGAHLGSGFPAEWKRTDKEYMTGQRPTFSETIPTRAKVLAETYVPFSWSGSNFALTFPVKAGMTKDRFRQEYSRAYEDGDHAQMLRLERAAAYNDLPNWRDLAESIKRRSDAFERKQKEEETGRSSRRRGSRRSGRR